MKEGAELKGHARLSAAARFVIIVRFLLPPERERCFVRNERRLLMFRLSHRLFLADHITEELSSAADVTIQSKYLTFASRCVINRIKPS